MPNLTIKFEQRLLLCL